MNVVLRALRRDIDLVLLTCIGVALIVVLFYLGGCATQAEAFRDNSTHVYPDGGGHSPAIGGLLSRLSTLSWICLVVGVIGVIASFYGPLKAFIDSKLAIIVVGVGVALPLLAALIEPIAEHVSIFRWIVGGMFVAGAVLAGWPWFHAIKNYVSGTRCIGCPAGDPAPLHPSPEEGA